MLHVPFNGSAPLINALVGGQVPASVDTLADLAEMHRAGKIRILASSGTQRSTALPEVPTFAELGYKDIEGLGRVGFLAPAGTPKAAVDKLNAAIVKALVSPDLRERLLKLGLEPQSGSSEAFGKVLVGDALRWGPLVKVSGYTGIEGLSVAVCFCLRRWALNPTASFTSPSGPRPTYMNAPRFARQVRL